ncbi:MAG: hypothetical protein JWM10_2629, partial [Myxococcaceae bacterium]|nr:hypothetical protein [Myxococcaceae bacterium]
PEPEPRGRHRHRARHGDAPTTEPLSMPAALQPAPTRVVPAPDPDAPDLGNPYRR